MKTKIFKERDLASAADILLDGGIIAFPTETVFGLGVVYDDIEAFNKLVSVKNRPADKPFTMMVSDAFLINKYAEIDNKAQAVINAFFPGEVTILVKPKPGLQDQVTLNSRYIGIRVPGLEITRKLLHLVGKPLLVPSANKAEEAPCLTSGEVLEVFNREIDGVVEGETVSNVPTTIVQIDTKIKLIRQGSVSFEAIKKVWEEAK